MKIIEQVMLNYYTFAEIKMFLKELLNPEGYGHAVTEEVRDHSKFLLNILERDGHER
jgi:hypothetical protein